MHAIIGLGNPGNRYVSTRHNVGFMAIDYIAGKTGIKLTDKHKLSSVGEGFIGDTRVILAKPRTFMNNSGEAITYIINKFHVAKENLLVVYDDLDLPLGKIRIRPNGGPGGHKGIGSIISTLGNKDIARIRIGIGRSAIKNNEIEYVLGKFDADEKEIVEQANIKVLDIVGTILNNGIDEAMNLHNSTGRPV